MREGVLIMRRSGFDSPRRLTVMSRDTVSTCIETLFLFRGGSGIPLVMAAPSSPGSRPGPSGGLRPALTPAVVARLAGIGMPMGV
jgi:hypothetical protein